MQPTLGCADLALLHSLLCHYARQLWGVQKTRIALSHRVAAMRRDGLAEQWCLPLVTATRDMAATEHAIGTLSGFMNARHGHAHRLDVVPLPDIGQLIAALLANPLTLPALTAVTALAALGTAVAAATHRC